MNAFKLSEIFTRRNDICSRPPIYLLVGTSSYHGTQCTHMYWYIAFRDISKRENFAKKNMADPFLQKVLFTRYVATLTDDLTRGMFTGGTDNNDTHLVPTIRRRIQGGVCDQR